jgi:signal recognition particle GTPase
VVDEIAWAEYNKAQSNLEGGASSDLKPPERTQQQISEQRNQLTSQKGDLESKLLELAQEGMEVKLAPALKEENKLNVILIGPNSVGRTTVANYMA